MAPRVSMLDANIVQGIAPYRGVTSRQVWAWFGAFAGTVLLWMLVAFLLGY